MLQAALILLALFIGFYIDFEIDVFTDADGTKHSRFNISIKKSSFTKD